jgi:hypothetical protein
MPQRVWPPLPRDGAPQPPPPIANPLERARRAAEARAARGLLSRRPPPGLEAPPRVPYEADRGAADEARALASDPRGDFLLASRTPWIVRYRTAVLAGGGGSGGGLAEGALLREVIHRPLQEQQQPQDGGGGAGSGSTAGGGGGRTLVVSSYAAATEELVSRSKQRCTDARQPFKVGAGWVGGGHSVPVGTRRSQQPRLWCSCQGGSTSSFTGHCAGTGGGGFAPSFCNDRAHKHRMRPGCCGVHDAVGA